MLKVEIPIAHSADGRWQVGQCVVEIDGRHIELSAIPPESLIEDIIETMMGRALLCWTRMADGAPPSRSRGQSRSITFYTAIVASNRCGRARNQSGRQNLPPSGGNAKAADIGTPPRFLPEDFTNWLQIMEVTRASRDGAHMKGVLCDGATTFE